MGLCSKVAPVRLKIPFRGFRYVVDGTTERLLLSSRMIMSMDMQFGSLATHMYMQTHKRIDRIALEVNQ